MRMRPVLFALVILAACVAAPACFADNGENSAAIADAVKNGVSAAAPSAFGGNWLGAAFGFLAGAIPGLLAVLNRQAQDKWNLFHSQQHIDTARAQAQPAAPAAPTVAPTA
jgi:hypothetical protein